MGTRMIENWYTTHTGVRLLLESEELKKQGQGHEDILRCRERRYGQRTLVYFVLFKTGIISEAKTRTESELQLENRWAAFTCSILTQIRVTL